MRDENAQERAGRWLKALICYSPRLGAFVVTGTSRDLGSGDTFSFRRVGPGNSVGQGKHP